MWTGGGCCETDGVRVKGKGPNFDGEYGLVDPCRDAVDQGIVSAAREGELMVKR